MYTGGDFMKSIFIGISYDVPTGFNTTLLSNEVCCNFDEVAELFEAEDVSRRFPEYSAKFCCGDELVTIKMKVFINQVSNISEPIINMIEVNDVPMCDYSDMFDELKSMKKAFESDDFDGWWFG